MGAQETQSASGETYGPWNPGITSHPTPSHWRRCTIFRPENVLRSFDDAAEYRDVTGIPLPELVVWRPERMVLHEVLVRVAADYEVSDPEGADVKSLGVNFRRMTRAVLQRHVLPRLDEITRDYGPMRDAIARLVNAELELVFRRAAEPPPLPRRRGLAWPRKATAERFAEPSPHEDGLIDAWRSKALRDPQLAAVYDALVRVVSAIRCLHGRLWGRPEMLEPIVTGLACNVRGAEIIAERAGPLIAQGAAAEGFRSLPAQDHPIAFSTKGASAAGKSTMRPQLRALATRMGANWGDFALVSPDIFRRDLLDIDSLGAGYKYFGTFTSHELEVVDRKLDRYLDQKAKRGDMSHVLIDRFRFDSFAPNSQEQRQLLARHGKRRLVYYLFMITPPEKTVERAWKRGLDVGRYKPVDDLLAHNVEAYSGMQAFFLARALHPESRNQHYEFVDNDVPMGEIPLTVAFGSRGEFNVLDLKRLVDMDRFRKINVNARRPEDLYPAAYTLAVENNVAFLRTCVREFPVVNLADRSTRRIYARFEHGRLAWQDKATLDSLVDRTTIAALKALAPQLLLATSGAEASRDLDPAEHVTLGRWDGG